MPTVGADPPEDGAAQSGVIWSRDGSVLRLGSAGGGRPPVGGLVFDLGGTLDADGAAWGDRFRCLLGRAFPGLDDESIKHAIEAGERAVIGHEGAASLSLAEMVALHTSAQFDSLGCSEESKREILAFRFLDDTMTVLQRRRPLLERLAERLPLAVVSNGCGNTRALLAEAGIADYFRVVVDSSEVGVWKPDSGILRPAIEALSIEPARLAVVGDRLDRDVAAGQAAGTQTVWVKAGVEAGDRRALALAQAQGYQVDAVVPGVGQLDPEAP